MRQLLIMLMMLPILLACGKSNEDCYECQKTNGSSAWSDAGCYSNDEWNDAQIVNNVGQILNKGTQCRKK